MKALSVTHGEPQEPHHVIMQWTGILTPKTEDKEEKENIKPTGASL
jgi:hypothetical protein